MTRYSLLDRELEMALPTPVQGVDLPVFAEHGLVVEVKRDDLIHPLIIGNKLRKLLGHFEQCRRAEISTVLTFGGRHSNHVLAVAQAGAELGFSTIGVVRGRDLRGPSAVLEECRRVGMRIVPVDAGDYYPAQKLPVSRLSDIVGCPDALHVIPEGGASEFSLDGTAAVLSEIEDVGQYAYIVCAVGTGATAVGLALGLDRLEPSVATRVLAIAVVRGYRDLPEQGQLALAARLGHSAASELRARRIVFDGSAPFGRFGPPDADVLEQLRQLQAAVRFPLDYVYTGKVLLHLRHLAGAGGLQRGSKLLFLHTGGYQTAAIAWPGGELAGPEAGGWPTLAGGRR